MVFELKGRREGTAGAALQVKQWVRDHLVGEDVTLVVSELACHEPGCPPVETVIAVLDRGANRSWKLHQPLLSVTEPDIVALAESLQSDGVGRSAPDEGPVL